MENTLRLLLSVFIVCTGNEIQKVYFTDDLPNKITLQCPQNQTISVKEFTTDNVKCKTDENNNKCLQILTNKLTTECINRNNCTLSSDIWSMNDCHRTPRYIITKYRCNSWVWRSKTVKTAITCSTTLSEINCRNNLFYIYLEIENVVLDMSEFSSNCNNTIQELQDLCNGRVICLKRPDNSQCLFHPREATVSYFCKDPYALLSSTSSPVENTETCSTKKTKTETNEDISSTLVNTFLTTTSSSHVVYPEHITLDQEGRVLLTNISEDMTVLVCGEAWDNRNAYVVCRYQNNSFIGIAKTIGGVQGYETIPIVFRCDGNETNLFDCNKILLNRSCNTSLVAAVTCCKGNDSANNCPSTRVDKITLGERANGIAIGVSVGLCVTILVVALSLVFIFRRFNICKKAKNSSSINSNKDYVGNQGIALPRSSKNTNSKHFKQNESGHCIKGVFKYNEDIPQLTSIERTPAPLMATAKSCPHFSGNVYIKTALENDRYEYTTSISDENKSAADDKYACLEDGVYDQTNKNRQVSNDSNVYSHTVDTVYDTSERNVNKKQTADTYNHFTGRKSDDNYDLAIRKC